MAIQIISKIFTYKIRVTNKCRKPFQGSKTALTLSCYCHVSWDTLCTITFVLLNKFESG